MNSFTWFPYLTIIIETNEMKKLKIYFFAAIALGVLSCSGDDMNEETGTDADFENIELRNFISTIESWTNYPQTSVEWSHEIDDQGYLVESTMYEKYPRRVIWKIEYFQYNENQLPIEYQKTYYSFGEINNFLTWDVWYSEDGLLQGLTAYNDGSYSHEYSFSQLDDRHRVITSLYYGSSGEFIHRDIREYDLKGNHRSLTRFNTESGNDDSSLIGEWNYLYTSFGDRESYTYTSGETGYTVDNSYSYRDDFTLQSIESFTQNQSDETVAVNFWEYDQEERLNYQRTINGDSRWEYVEFFPNGDLKIAEYYLRDELIWIQTIAEDGSSEWKVFNPDDGTYKIEYQNAEGTVYKVEYYDADGNLLNTESYSATRENLNFQKLKHYPENPRRTANLRNTFFSDSERLE